MVQQPPGPPPGGMQPPPPPPGQPPQAPMGAPRGQFDTSKMPVPDIVVAGGALLSFIFTLLAWYKVEFMGFVAGSGRGGYQTWPTVIYILLALFAGFFVVNEMANFVDINLPLGPIYLIWSIVGTFFTLLAFVIRPGDWDYVKMNWVIWIIMIVLSIIPIAGGFMKMQQAK
jgi:hypothetical protein